MRQLPHKRRLRSFPAGTHDRAMQKMPFTERLLVLATHPIEALVNQTCTVTVSTPDQLTANHLLITDPKCHPVGHEQPTISIANHVMHIDMTEKQAMTLGCTFANVIKYSGSGGLKRAFLAVDLRKYGRHERFEFVLQRLLTQYGPFQCRVPVSDSLVEMEHSLNINGTVMPDNPEEIVHWSGLMGLQVKTTVDLSRCSIHAYSISDALVERSCINTLLQQQGVLCIVGVSAKCSHPFKDEKIPAIPDTPPPTFFLVNRDGHHCINFT